MDMTRRLLFPPLVASLVLSHCVSHLTAQPSTRKALALFESLDTAKDYSQFLSNVEDLGYEVVRKGTTDGDLHLRSWDDWKYDRLIIFSSGQKAFGGALDNEAILDFVESGRDLVLAVNSQVSDDLRNLASDLGVDFEPKGSAVLDPSNHVTSSKTKDGSLVVSRQIADEPYILGNTEIESPILYRGVGSTFSPESEQVVQVLGGELSQYMGKPDQDFIEELQVVGRGISLVTTAQTQNDARVLISGSQDLFSDKFFDVKSIQTRQGLEYSQSGNREFAKELLTWTFHERSLLKAGNLRHKSTNSTETPSHYRITDHVDFEIEILEYNRGQWQPFKASDVQLEFVMLDPHIRTFLQHDGKGKYFTTFKIPDVYGVFKFVIDYKRRGLTHLDISEQVPVRHFRHNEFERFLVPAYPYYAGVFSCMLAFWVFGFVFLYSKDS